LFGLKGGPANFIMAAGIFLILMALLTKLTDYTRQIKSIHYSNYLKSIEADQVTSIYISGQDRQGLLKDGTKFETVAPGNPRDLKLLESHGVDIVVANQSGQMNIWYMLLFGSFVISLLALWYFMRSMKQSNGSGSGNIFSI